MNKLMPGFTAGAEIASTSLLVAGMHRSGTSALARVLSLLGAELPRTLMRPGADNPKGFWESAPIAEVNDALLSELGSSWDDVLAFLVRRTELKGQAAAVRRIRNVLSAEFSGDASAIVVKEPRIALLLDVWLDALSAEGFRPRIIIPLRNPLEVSASLATRSGFAAGRSLLLWLVYFLAAERSSRGAVRSFVHYPNLLEDWRGVMRRLEHELGFTFAGWTPTAELEIDSFLSNEDRHQIVAPHLLAAREDIVDWIKRAYQWGLEAAAPGGAPDPTVLDAIASEFTAAMRVFAPVIAEQRTALQAGTDRIAALRQDLDQREGGIAALRHDLDQREGTIAALTQDLDQREERIAALGQELNQREERIAALGQELDRREGRIAGLRNDVESLTQTADARLAELGDLGRELASRAEALADLGQQVAQRDQLVGALRDDVAALARKREADVTALRREVAGLRISESRQAARLEALETSAERRATHIEALEAHVEALEASARSAMACVEGEAGERRGLEIIAAAQREFIERSMPLGRRVRRALWRRPQVRPLS
jgi:predicted  nucleic acid-binding Zn-ribbon protein